MSSLKILRQRQRTAHVISRIASAMKMVARSHLRRSQDHHKISQSGLQELRESMESLLFYVAEQEGVLPKDLELLRNTSSSAFFQMDLLEENKEHNDTHSVHKVDDGNSDNNTMGHEHSNYKPKDLKDLKDHQKTPSSSQGHEENADHLGPLSSGGTLLSLPRILRPGHALAPWIVLVVTSKGGLCGGFNQSLLRSTKEVLKSFEEKGIPTRLWVFGEKGKNDFQKLSPKNFMSLDAQGNNLYELLEELDHCSFEDESCLLDVWDSLGGKKEDEGAQEDNNHNNGESKNTSFSSTKEGGGHYGHPSEGSWKKTIFSTPNNIKRISHSLTYLFCQGKIQGCTLVYSKFYNVLRQEPVCENILPLFLTPNPKGECIDDGLFTYEPNGKKVLEKGLNLLVDNIFQGRLQEHYLSEYGARINAMENAEKNAKDLFSALSLEYNYLRQSKITAEIIEINNY